MQFFPLASDAWQETRFLLNVLPLLTSRNAISFSLMVVTKNQHKNDNLLHKLARVNQTTVK